ncbi:hypothetical protein LENED_012152 [Lentinula edodes]|uniref:Uncharacterized protein n=1 Tax=Lentinula edodes TaxID=5353 RepID=A0A1Q3ES34_LENED|nr:hypothetical protein LENED_012152 [Lentinula edodes]
MQNKYIDLLEQTRTSLDLSLTSEKRFERSEFKGLDFPEQEFMMSPLPEFTKGSSRKSQGINEDIMLLQAISCSYHEERVVKQCYVDALLNPGPH